MPIFCCIPDLPFQRLVTTSEYINHSSTFLWAMWEPVVSTTHYHLSHISLEHHLDYTEEINRVGQRMGGLTEALSHGIIKYQVPYFPEGYRLETTNVKREMQSDRERHHMMSLKCRLKKLYRWTYIQNGNRLIDLENQLMVTKGEREQGGGVGNMELTVTHCYI